MENMTSSYETLYIIDPSIGEEGVQGLVAKVSELIAANGTIDTVNEWGNRRLAYPIRVGSRDIVEGYYVLVTYTSARTLPAELDRIFNITDGLLRALTINIEK